ncbi:MAG TPA: GIDE domain-containing protein [Steroidobacteraceae bacterium]|nr:GIDE domain-containing protein [Steroidobacteraceae bacterium]
MAGNTATALWILAAVSGLLALAALGASLWRLRRDRYLADTPLVRIRSAPQGYVRVEGIATPPPGESLRSPLTGRACVWWDYSIECKEQSERGPTVYRSVEKATSVTPFVLSDADGECLVGPVGAEVTATINDRWRGNTPHPTGLPYFQSGFRITETGDYVYHERLISPGSRLSVLGELRSHTEFGAVDEKTKEILRLWKLDQPALLRRFDRNHDGQIDAAEWDAARAAAHTQAEATVLHSPIERVGVVGQTTHGEPFLIAPLDAKRLVRRERLRAALLLLASVLLLVLCLWAISAVESRA